MLNFESVVNDWRCWEKLVANNWLQFKIQRHIHQNKFTEAHSIFFHTNLSFYNPWNPEKCKHSRNLHEILSERNEKTQRIVRKAFKIKLTRRYENKNLIWLNVKGSLLSLTYHGRSFARFRLQSSLKVRRSSGLRLILWIVLTCWVLTIFSMSVITTWKFPFPV